MHPAYLPGRRLRHHPTAGPALGLILGLGLGTRLAGALRAVAGLHREIVSLGARGIAVECGCGGIASKAAAGHPRYTLDVLRDVGYLVPALGLIWRRRSPLALDSALLGGEPSQG